MTKFLFYFNFVLSFHITSAKIDSAPTPNNGICTTPGCIEAAYNLLHSIDFTADPCDDFYHYACGKWFADNPIPDDESSYGATMVMREQQTSAMRSLLQNDKTKLKIDSKAVNFTRRLYQRCTNGSRLSELGSVPLRDRLKSLGDWPLLDADWKRPANFSLATLLASFYTGEPFHVSPFWKVLVTVDVKNVTRYILSLDEPAISLPRDYFLNASRYGKYLDAYEKYIRDVVDLLAKDGGMSTKSKDVDAGIKDIVKLETEIARFKRKPEDNRNPLLTYNLRTFGQLKQDVPSFDWQTYFASILPKDVQPILTDGLLLNIANPSFMGNVSQLLQTTEVKALTNYALWRLVMLSVSRLDERYRDLDQDFNRVKNGQEEKTPRWKMCVAITERLVPVAAGAVYVDSHFSKDDKAEIEKIVKNLMNALGAILRETDWMDDVTKTAALNKLKFILPQLGYQDMAKNATLLDDYYKDLDYAAAASGFFQSVLAAEKHSSDRNFRYLMKNVDRNRWDASAAMVNAFYSPGDNVINVPAGFLQPPVFNGFYPKFVNYGAIGSVIGHELTHAFDDQGSQYDQLGRLRNWWSNSSVANFKNKTACIVNQYNAYEVPDIKLHVNGKLTQGENIADNGGIKEAYRAYRTYIQKVGQEEERLPGLDLNNNQAFFLSLAKAMCNQMKPDQSRKLTLTDPHSPYMFRAIGALSNMPEFAIAFKCKAGSRMNPARRCAVW